MDHEEQNSVTGPGGYDTTPHRQESSLHPHRNGQ